VRVALCHGRHQLSHHRHWSRADAVATLVSDMLMAQDGWRRGGRSPFLLGY
jgi:hypothetical protein